MCDKCLMEFYFYSDLLRLNTFNFLFVMGENPFGLLMVSTQWGHVVVPLKNLPLVTSPIALVPEFGIYLR